MVFSSYGNSSSFYLPLDSDQSVTFYKNENSLFSAPPPASLPPPPASTVPCSNMSPNELPFVNNSHGTVVVDAVCQDFQPVAHLSSNGYYGYVPPAPPTQAPKMMMSVVNTTGTVSPGVQLDCQQTDADAEMDCGVAAEAPASEMENFQQLQQQRQQHLRKRKEYSGEEEAMADCKRRKTWLEEEHQQQQQAAGFPQTYGWNQQPHQQMDCHEDSPMIGSFQQQPFNGSTISTSCSFPVQATTIPIAMVQPSPMAATPVVVQQQQQPPKNHLPSLVEGFSPRRAGHYAGSNRCDPRRWNIAMPTSRPQGTGCSTVGGHLLLLEDGPPASARQFTAIIGGCNGDGGGGDAGRNGPELEDLFVSLHGSGFFLAG